MASIATSWFQIHQRFAPPFLHCIYMALVVASCFMVSTANANQSALFRHNPVPGGIAMVSIAKTDTTMPTVHWRKRAIAVIDAGQNWQAIVGIGLAEKPGTYELKVTRSDNNAEKIKFTVSDHQYEEQRITIKNKRKVNPAPMDMDRINKETARVREVKAYRYKKLLAENFQWPLKGIVSSPFGLKRFFNDQPRRPHGGIDIAAETGTPIYAPATGLVVETGDYFFNGNCIFLEHGLGLQTFYAHLSKIHVKPGDKVEAGQLIGEVGATGRVTGPHLHWSVGLNGTWVDPTLLVGEQ